VPEHNVQESSQDKHHSKKKSIIQTLLDEYNKQPVKVVKEDSISRKLLNSIKVSKTQLQDTEKSHIRYCKKYNINYYNK